MIASGEEHARCPALPNNRRLESRYFMRAHIIAPGAILEKYLFLRLLLLIELKWQQKKQLDLRQKSGPFFWTDDEAYSNNAIKCYYKAQISPSK